MKFEILSKIIDDLDFCNNGLQEFLSNATATESIIIMDMIRDATNLRDRAYQLRAAVGSDNTKAG